MTDRVLYQKIVDVLATLDRDSYPEIACTLDGAISEDGEVFYDAYDLADELCEADTAKLLPSDVATLIMEIFLEEIEGGNAGAMTDLGSLYYTGRIGEQSYEKAVEYYTMADKLGERQATENLGYCYYYGRLGEVDYKRAYHYFVKGALDNHLNSLYKIGDMYRYGYYVDKDEEEAYRIYNHCYREMDDYCAELIGADICKRMGEVYFYGIGTAINYELALKMYQEAERYFYRKIRGGDFFARKGLCDVLERLSEIREVLLRDLPRYEWVK